jgi:hypothetical protein
VTDALRLLFSGFATGSINFAQGELVMLPGASRWA